MLTSGPRRINKEAHQQPTPAWCLVLGVDHGAVSDIVTSVGTGVSYCHHFLPVPELSTAGSPLYNGHGHCMKSWQIHGLEFV